MNKLAKATMLTAAAVLVGARGAHAQYAANDLVLGFDRIDNGGVGPQPGDYVINLGNYQSVVGVGGSTPVDLSSSFNFSTFTALYGALNSGVSMSIVGGNGATAGRDIFASAPRSGLGTPDAPGSFAPATLTSSFMASGANDVAALMGVSGLNLGAGTSATVAQNDPNSFNTWILSTAPPSYFSGTGIDPRGTTSGPVIYEDLYRARNGVNGNAFQYFGYLALDLSGSPSLTFTPSTVPEPATCALFGTGLLLFLLRRRSTARNP